MFRFDTFLWFTDVVFTKTQTVFAFLVFVVFASGMRSTVNFFAEVLSWILFVDLFTEMVFTAIGIVFAIDWFTGVGDTGFGVSAVIVTFAVDWVAGVLLAFNEFSYVEHMLDLCYTSLKI